MKYKLKTAPSIEPLSFATLPTDQLRLNGTDEQSLVESYIKAARQIAEDRQNRVLISQTWELYMDSFKKTEILLDKTPVQSITSVKYYDDENALQTLDSSLYELDNVSEPARLRPVSGESWPSTYDKYNAVLIEFVAGYGDAADDVPESTRDAMLMIVANFYENRGDEGHRSLPPAVWSLLDMNRINRFM